MTAPRTARAEKIMHLPDLDPHTEEARIAFALKWRLKKRVRFLVTDPQLPSGEEWGKYETFRAAQISAPPARLEDGR